MRGSPRENGLKHTTLINWKVLPTPVVIQSWLNVLVTLSPWFMARLALNQPFVLLFCFFSLVFPLNRTKRARWSLSILNREANENNERLFLNSTSSCKPFPLLPSPFSLWPTQSQELASTHPPAHPPSILKPCFSASYKHL